MKTLTSIFTGLALIAITFSTPAQNADSRKEYLKTERKMERELQKWEKREAIANARDFREMTKAEIKWHKLRAKEAAKREKAYSKLAKKSTGLAKAENELYSNRAKEEYQWHSRKAAEAEAREDKIRRDGAGWNSERAEAEAKLAQERRKAEEKWYRDRSKMAAKQDRALLKEFSKENKRSAKAEKKLYKARAKSESRYYNKKAEQAGRGN